MTNNQTSEVKRNSLNKSDIDVKFNADSTQELDEIIQRHFRHLAAKAYAEIDGYRPEVENASALWNKIVSRAENDLLDWHNKQIEAVLDRLLEHGEDFTTFGDGSRSVAVEYIEAERKHINKTEKQ